MKNINPNIINEVQEATNAFEAKYQEYLTTLEAQEKLVDEFYEKRDETLSKLYEAFGFESNKELIKALRLVGKKEVAEVTETEETVVE